jgi:hypothetical protein
MLMKSKALDIDFLFEIENRGIWSEVGGGRVTEDFIFIRTLGFDSFAADVDLPKSQLQISCRMISFIQQSTTLSTKKNTKKSTTSFSTRQKPQSTYIRTRFHLKTKFVS